MLDTTLQAGAAPGYCAPVMAARKSPSPPPEPPAKKGRGRPKGSGAGRPAPRPKTRDGYNLSLDLDLIDWLKSLKGQAEGPADVANRVLRREMERQRRKG